MKVKKINIILETENDDEVIFNALRGWLRDNFQNCEIKLGDLEDKWETELEEETQEKEEKKEEQQSGL